MFGSSFESTTFEARVVAQIEGSDLRLSGIEFVCGRVSLIYLTRVCGIIVPLWLRRRWRPRDNGLTLSTRVGRTVACLTHDAFVGAQSREARHRARSTNVLLIRTLMRACLFASEGYQEIRCRLRDRSIDTMASAR